ncbi:MAG TPA: hypothetical protein VMV96_04725 [Acidimicrobiales bacterium]|nr:hypothetical protein [Acidimicrobiales bacterium]
MNDEIVELYDYAALRKLSEATMSVVEVSRPVAVLGGSQLSEVLTTLDRDDVALRRRRGGGGLVLLQPGDLWIDFWIPASDARWSHDVHVSSMMAGAWWADALSSEVTGDVVVHRGSLEGSIEHRVVCFAGRGPGEVFVDDRKAVGVTQWRVREGIFLSTVVHSKPSLLLLDILLDRPDGLEEAINHHVITTLGIEDTDRLVDSLRARSGPWRHRHLFLTA